ncbi:MAG: SpoIIE family protein phosphatase [Candidatus Brocadiaceae bacterium]|nr:SpoIIE family protein phosphatase [Candidatus Brocadiaceae bacterium]
MVKLLWDSGESRGAGPEVFRPEDYRDLLARLSALAGVRLAFEREREARSPDRALAPVRLGSTRTGWVVAARADGPAAAAAAEAVVEAAAEVTSRLLTAERDVSALAAEVADHSEELNFLYEMNLRVGGLTDEDEICQYVVKEAAYLLDCERASLMLEDRATGVLKIRAGVGLPEDIPEDLAVQPGQGISGKVFQSGTSLFVRDGDPLPADSLQVGNLRDAKSFLSVPLKITPQEDEQEHILGVFNLTRKRLSDRFTASDLKLVRAVAASAAMQIHNCRLIDAEQRRRELEHELQLAAGIQLSLLPEAPLRFGAVKVGGHCRPARHVGGDLFDYWVRGDHLCLVIADVSGHDLGAALMAAAVRSVMRSESAHRRSVAGLLEQVNRALFDDLANAELLVSAFYAEIDRASAVMTFGRAGHPKPLRLQSGRAENLDTAGTLLGLCEDGQFEERAVRLTPGDAIVLYTDGLAEAQDAEGRSFGPEGVARAALESLGRPSGDVAAHIVGTAARHCEPSPGSDDMTALVVQFGGKQEE